MRNSIWRCEYLEETLIFSFDRDLFGLHWRVFGITESQQAKGGLMYFASGEDSGETVQMHLLFIHSDYWSHRHLRHRPKVLDTTNCRAHAFVSSQLPYTLSSLTLTLFISFMAWSRITNIKIASILERPLLWQPSRRHGLVGFCAIQTCSKLLFRGWSLYIQIRKSE